MKRNDFLKNAIALLLCSLLLLGTLLPASAAVSPSGDADGDGKITVSDVVALRGYIVGSETPTEAQVFNCDLDGNGKLTVSDVVALRQLIVNGVPSELPDEDVQIRVLGSTAVKASGKNALDYGKFSDGDTVEFSSNYRYFWIQINDQLGETMVYSESGTYSFLVPKGIDCYANDAFSAESNTIRARVATAEELAQNRNLAVNAYDFRYLNEETAYDAATEALINDSTSVKSGEVIAYPHAYANRVTENKTIFNARNAIDGVTETGYNHSSYPYQSWGCGRYDDAEFVVYFGREVTLDRLAFVLRADFSGSVEHDTYWESITAEFSDGSTMTFETVKGGSRQEFKFPAVTTTSVRLKNLIRHDNPNSGMWAALIELEAWGADLLSENPTAQKTSVTPDFGGKPVAETIDTYSAADIAQTMRTAYRYFTDNIGVTDDGWKEGVYYIGLSDAYITTGDLDYYLDCRCEAEYYQYKVNGGKLTDFGDDYCISQMYLAMNRLSPGAHKLQSTLENADYNLSLGKLDYHWCDALFMSGMVFTELSNLTGDPRYRETEHATYLEWKAKLYSEENDLWYRDLGYVGKTTPAGRPIFWSRGNAWVFAYLARQLAYLTDTESEMYKTLLADFRELAVSIKALQREDGTWNSCLNDPAYFGGPETTGTAGFLYGYTIGVQLGLLDREEYLPVALRAYQALTGFCMREDGRIGYMEQEAADPSQYVSEAHSKDLMNSFGTGLFLMGAAALMRMCEDYTLPALEIPLDTQSRSISRFMVEPGYYDGPITATASDSQEGNEVEHLFDHDVSGAVGTRWSAAGMYHWAIGDLGKEVALYKVCVYPMDRRDYLYKVEVSEDGKKWATVVDRTKTNTGAVCYTDSFAPVYARYVRLTTNGAATYGTVGAPWLSLSEMLLYPYTGEGEILHVEDIYVDPNPEMVFVPGEVTASYTAAAPADGYYTGEVSVTATSQQEGNEAEHLFDKKWSNAATGVRWSAMNYPNSATADFGKVLSLSKLTLMIYEGRQYYYQLEVSADGKDWQTVAYTEEAYKTAENHTYSLSQPVEARYVRLTVNGCNPVTYGGAWISIKELLVYTLK